MTPPWAPVPYRPEWAVAADRLLDRLRAALAATGDVDGWSFEHIGSTAVPGMAAKPYLDLQIGVPVLFAWGGPADRAIRSVGFVREHGARPDSPGVDHDGPLTGGPMDTDCYRKRLYTLRRTGTGFADDPGTGGADAGGADPTTNDDLVAILHVRRSDNPWLAETVRVRDWLRGSAAARTAYERVKFEAVTRYADAGDFNDYTRAKSPFFAAVRAGRVDPAHG